MLEPIKVRAQEEGVTVSGLVRQAVLTYLSLGSSDLKEIPIDRRADENLGDFERHNVSWGRLRRHLEDRARAEKMSLSGIARRAARLYLANGDLPKVLEFSREMRGFHAELAKIGGNLNQIAVHINMHDNLREKDLGQVHIALIGEFKKLADFYKRLEKELERRIP